jgi:hypothetical protein
VHRLEASAGATQRGPYTYTRTPLNTGERCVCGARTVVSALAGSSSMYCTACCHDVQPGTPSRPGSAYDDTTVDSSSSSSNLHAGTSL